MKKTTQILAFLFIFSSSVFSQAKKPTIMVIPSDRFCISNDYYKEFTELGESFKIPDYKKALQTDNKLRLAMTQLASIMSEREFPLKDLESELKKLKNEEFEASLIMGRDGGTLQELPIDVIKRVAKADIIIDLDYTVNESGLGMRYLTINLKGIDAYTGKVIASASGTGKPLMTNQIEILLEIAVKDFMDNFIDQLNAHFEDMFENGREVSIQLKLFDTSGVDFYEEFTYFEYDIDDELNYIIEEFFQRNTVKGRFTISDVTATTIKLEQVRIPVYDKKERAMDTRRFVSNLRRFLKKEPFNLDSKIHLKGLGEAWLIIGEK